MENKSAFYEKYWQNSSEAPPSQDPLNKKRVDIFIKELKNKNIRKILDIGCGSGINTRALKEAGFEVAGVDVSENAIFEAKRKYPEIEFSVAGIEKLPFPDEVFDAIYCTEVIEHIYDTERVVKELSRVLKRGGYLFISTPYHGFLKNLIITLFHFEKHFNPSGPHIRFFTRNSLQKLLENNGLKIQKALNLGRFWPIWMDMIAINKKTKTKNQNYE